MCSLTGRKFNYCETLKDFYLSQMVVSPTRITGETQYILDLVITNQPDNVLNLHIVNHLICSFRPIIHLYCSIILRNLNVHRNKAALFTATRRLILMP